MLGLPFALKHIAKRTVKTNRPHFNYRTTWQLHAETDTCSLHFRKLKTDYTTETNLTPPYQ